MTCYCNNVFLRKEGRKGGSKGGRGEAMEGRGEGTYTIKTSSKTDCFLSDVLEDSTLLAVRTDKHIFDPT